MLDTLCYIGYVTCSEQGTYSFTALDCEIMTAYKSNYNIWPSIRMSKIQAACDVKHSVCNIGVCNIIIRLICAYAAIISQSNAVKE